MDPHPEGSLLLSKRDKKINNNKCNKCSVVSFVGT